MSNYYCIMAGAPELKLSDTQPGYSIGALRQELQAELGRQDERLLRFLFLGHDCRNLVALLRNPEAPLEANGNLGREELLQIVEEARGVDLGNSPHPRFLLDYVREYDAQAGRPDYYPEDEVLMHYYHHCTKHCPNGLMRRWYGLNLDVTNLMTALIARQQGWRVADYVKGDGEVAGQLRTSDAPDFGLSGLYDFVPQVMDIVDEEDPVRKERLLDALKWQWLDEQTFADTFSVEAVFAYLCKLEIQERWSHLDPEQGRETFERIIGDLRGEAQVPEEFIRK